MNWQALFLSAEGRISRQTFWICAGVLVVASLVMGMIPVVGALASLALLWPWLVVLTKRLHDINRSGKLALAMLIPNLAASLLALAVGIMSMSPATALAALSLAGLLAAVGGLAMLVSVALLIWLAVSVGDAEANTYGPPPTEPAWTSV